MSFAITTALAGLAVLALVAAVGLSVMLVLPHGRAWLRAQLKGAIRHPIAWAFTVALVAAGGSLYLSEGLGFVPCTLCWYQRIAMYPLVVVVGVAWWRSDPSVWRFALPLAAIGLVISVYHVALQYQPNLEIVACSTAASCSARYLAVFGFVSIPVMAGAGFALLLTLFLVLRELQRPGAAVGESSV